MKISVLPTPYAHFRKSKGSRNHSKNGSKIAKNLQKSMPGNAMFLVFVFLRFFLDFVSILAPFWSSEGHSGAFKIKFVSIMAPRWSLRGLRGPSGVDFGSILAGVGEESSKIWTLLASSWADSGNVWRNVALLRQSFHIGPPR